MAGNKSSSRTVARGIQKRSYETTAGCYPHAPDALVVPVTTGHGACGVQEVRYTVGQVKTDIDITGLVQSFINCLTDDEVTNAVANLQSCLTTFAVRALVLNSQQVELTNHAQANQVVTMMIDRSKAMFGAGGAHYTESRIYWNVVQAFPSAGYTDSGSIFSVFPRTTGQFQLQYSTGLNPVVQFTQATTTFDGTNLEHDKATISANLLALFGILTIPKGTLIYAGAI